MKNIFSSINLAILITFSLYNAINLNAQTPILHPQFGINGISKITGTTEIVKFTLLDDSCIVSVGYAKKPNTIDQYDEFISKVDQHGQLVTSFGNNGTTYTALHHSCYPLTLLQTKDGGT